MEISYAITVCNEDKELKRLLDFLIKNVREGDEIVVQCDKENTTIEVLRVLNKCVDRVKVVEFPLNGHFADFKNNLTKECSGDYIFQIDADEIPHDILIEQLPEMLEGNPDNEVYLVPRVNTVTGLTTEHIQKWRWNVDEEDRVNWPDYQWRVWKNKPEIQWVNKVHEKLEGFNTYALLPAMPELALYHPKTIDRQEKQNELYSKL